MWLDKPELRIVNKGEGHRENEDPSHKDFCFAPSEMKSHWKFEQRRDMC